jgi:hypothetical protein
VQFQHELAVCFRRKVEWINTVQASFESDLRHISLPARNIADARMGADEALWAKKNATF